MNDKKRKIAITGSTGGLGSIVATRLATKNDLVLVDRNIVKSKALAERIIKTVPDASIEFVTCDLAKIGDVKNAVNALIGKDIDVLILNSGVYNVPLYKCDTGFNNVFQVNFVSQYYLARKLAENSPSLKKVVATSSIAHDYGKLDEGDVDFSLKKASSKIYGNSKRFLTFALHGYFKDKDVSLSVAHPGVTLTNMTDHYPKWITPLVKFTIKTFFPSPERAVRSILLAVDEDCDFLEWIGPPVFGVWGKPKKSVLKTCSERERRRIEEIAERIYEDLQ